MYYYFGMDRGTKNATDGISWLQNGDGALGEARDILHRIKELTIQALNDADTDEDKAALQMGFMLRQRWKKKY